MLTFESIGDLLRNLAAGQDLSAYGFIYVDTEHWHRDPASAILYLPSDDEVEEWDDTQGLPVVVAERGLRTLLGVADLEDVIDNVVQSGVDVDVETVIDAVNHYREYDDFKYE